ncbi:MAG: polysaccharide lyase family 7 protein [Myxococcota bacterium]
MYLGLLLVAGCSVPDAVGGDPDAGPGPSRPALPSPSPACRPAAETCDGIDNDCDGAVDEEAADASIWHEDADGDGHGAPGSSVVACEAPAGTVADAADCDDADADVHPDAAEACDGVDDDCDGAVDDGAECPGGSGADVPGELLDLTDWKLTLPIGESESPREVTQPELDTFELDPWFHMDAASTSVVFRANAGGVTTSGSGYPRSELREMADGGSARAAWSTTSGVHTMTITQAITHLPEVKPHAVAGQIHDAADDVVMIRLEDNYLYVEGGGEDLGALDTDYALGEWFTVRIVAEDGVIDVYYQDMRTPAVSVERDTTGCYFKAGVYTQSNPDRGDAPEAYAEVRMRELVITHH